MAKSSSRKRAAPAPEEQESEPVNTPLFAKCEVVGEDSKSGRRGPGRPKEGQSARSLIGYGSCESSLKPFYGDRVSAICYQSLEQLREHIKGGDDKNFNLRHQVDTLCQMKLSFLDRMGSSFAVGDIINGSGQVVMMFSETETLPYIYESEHFIRGDLKDISVSGAERRSENARRRSAGTGSALRGSTRSPKQGSDSQAPDGSQEKDQSSLPEAQDSQSQPESSGKKESDPEWTERGSSAAKSSSRKDKADELLSHSKYHVFQRLAEMDKRRERMCALCINPVGSDKDEAGAPSRFLAFVRNPKTEVLVPLEQLPRRCADLLSGIQEDALESRGAKKLTSLFSESLPTESNQAAFLIDLKFLKEKKVINMSDDNIQICFGVDCSSVLCKTCREIQAKSEFDESKVPSRVVKRSMMRKQEGARATVESQPSKMEYPQITPRSHNLSLSWKYELKVFVNAGSHVGGVNDFSKSKKVVLLPMFDIQALSLTAARGKTSKKTDVIAQFNDVFSSLENDVLNEFNDPENADILDILRLLSRRIMDVDKGVRNGTRWISNLSPLTLHLFEIVNVRRIKRVKENKKKLESLAPRLKLELSPASTVKQDNVPSRKQILGASVAGVRSSDKRPVETDSQEAEIEGSAGEKKRKLEEPSKEQPEAQSIEGENKPATPSLLSQQ